jgi:hypothetical protein
MNVFGHDDKSMKLEVAFSAIPIECLKEEFDVVLDHEQSSSVPSREGDEVCSRRGDESSRLQEQTSAAKAAIFA